ncbi:MAG TPA: dihydrofolate reductase family protein [Gemmatimonadaceae bacterium]|nr:dihydrofolate reductase family protein [Gemmatimonadaceae bacterium]
MPSRPRRLRYSVAMSLDGFLGRHGKDDYSWIVGDSSVDFVALVKEFDTAVLGRKTWDVARAMGQNGVAGLDAIVFSKSLAPETRKALRVTPDDPVATVAALKKQPGKDIWLFGGGELFRTLLQAGLVDTVEVAVVPVLLGDGIPLLPPGAETTLELVDSRTLPSGMVMLAYSIPGGAPASKIRHIKKTSRRKSSRPRKTSRPGKKKR